MYRFLDFHFSGSIGAVVINKVQNPLLRRICNISKDCALKTTLTLEHFGSANRADCIKCSRSSEAIISEVRLKNGASHLPHLHSSFYWEIATPQQYLAVWCSHPFNLKRIHLPIIKKSRRSTSLSL